MHHFTLHKTPYHAVMLWIIILDCAKTFLVYHLRGAAFWHHSSPTTLPFVRLHLLSSLRLDCHILWSMRTMEALALPISTPSKSLPCAPQPLSNSLNLQRRNSSCPGRLDVDVSLAQRWSTILARTNLVIICAYNHLPVVDHASRYVRRHSFSDFLLPSGYLT